MADRLSVDLDGLGDFARRLRRIQERLDAGKQNLRGNSRELGDSRVSAALEDFEEHWCDGRKKVSENAKALATMVSEAVRAYRSADDQLSEVVAGLGEQFSAPQIRATDGTPSVRVSAQQR